MKSNEQWQKDAELAYQAAANIQASFATAIMEKKKLTGDEMFTLLGAAMRVTTFFSELPEWHKQMRDAAW